MKTLYVFVVDLEKRINDTITTKGGLELYIDTRHEGSEFEHRVTEGSVVCSPLKYDTGVEPGDTLYFHHLVVLDGGQSYTGEDNHYSVIYNPDNAVMNQAIAYKSKKDGKVRCLAGWCLLEPVNQDKKIKSDVIDLIELKEKLPTTGKVAYICEEAGHMDLKSGDIVGFKENRDYRIKIEGKEYYRTRAE